MAVIRCFYTVTSELGIHTCINNSMIVGPRIMIHVRIKCKDPVWISRFNNPDSCTGDDIRTVVFMAALDETEREGGRERKTGGKRGEVISPAALSALGHLSLCISITSQQ